MPELISPDLLRAAVPQRHRARLADLLELAGSPGIRFLPRPLAEVVVSGEVLVIPARLHVDISRWVAAVLEWDDVRRQLALTVGTRHTDGYYRESCLRRLLPVTELWQVPYVMALVGEYVLEIATVAIAALEAVPALLTAFARDNRAFVETTRRRAISYYDCYYRGHSPNYAEFAPVAFLSRVLEAAASPSARRPQVPMRT